MRRWMAVMVAAAFFAACGEDEPEAKPDECVGEACEGPCEAESVEELCTAAAAACGEVEVVDRCGEARAISCGGCGPNEVCKDSVCVEKWTRPVEEACGAVPAEGVCVGFRALRRCEGSGEAARPVRENCAPDELCTETAAGAACVPVPCEEGQQVCTPEGNLKSCEDGQLVESPCADGCVRLLGQASCREAPPESVLHRGRLLYEHRYPNESLTDWAAPVLEPAADLTVYFFQGGELVAWNMVEADGSYELAVPATVDPSETLTFVAMYKPAGDDETLIGAVDPDLPPGFHATGQTGEQATWWAWEVSDARAEEHVIRESDGSGAIQVYQNLLAAVGKTAATQGSLRVPTTSVIYGPGVDYDCGACFYADREGRSAIAVSGGEFPAHQSDSVLLHEAGHYAFYTLGPDSGEGGIHCLGVPAPPGQALVEGHASWYSADLRNDPALYSKRMGTFSYWDIGRRAPAQVFAPPRHEEGLDQDMNESWVSAVLWDLSTSVGSGIPIHRGLMAQEMRPPFASRYIGLVWWNVDFSCRPIDPTPSGIPTPILSDLLDALVCGGFPAEVMSDVFGSIYPYEAEEASCK